MHNIEILFSGSKDNKYTLLHNSLAKCEGKLSAYEEILNPNPQEATEANNKQVSFLTSQLESFKVQLETLSNRLDSEEKAQQAQTNYIRSELAELRTKTNEVSNFTVMLESVKSNLEELKRNLNRYEHIIETQQAHTYAIEKEVTALTEDVSERLDEVKQSIGTTYVRWAHTSCPETATLVYSGNTLLLCRTNIYVYIIRRTNKIWLI